MGLQGNKATHDFLSLYTTAKDPTLQLHDAKPSPPPLKISREDATPEEVAKFGKFLAPGFFLKTHDFLQPLEKPSQSPAAANAGDKQQQHVLPGGIGTFSIRRAADAAAGRAAAAVKEEPRPPFALWGQPAVPEAGARGHQWALPYAALGVAGAGHVAASRQQPPERKGGGGGGGGGGFMDTGSRSSGGAGFDDDDDGLAARREGSSSLRELTVRVDAKGGSCSGSGTDQRPNTPRSKHSATEQRRRSKINDRFQILRDLLPNSDQKRDKASFLLEVIEYIRFLQEKVQKYEVSLPEWNQEHAKIMPWANIYFRSFWKNAQNKGQISGDALPDPLQIIRNGSSPEFVFSDKLDDNNHAVAPAAASGAQGHAETDPMAKVSYRSAETPMDVANKLDDNNHAVAPAAASGAQDHVETDPMAKVSYRSAETPMDVANNVMPQPPAHWTRSSPADDSVVNRKMLNDQDLTIDEGTISLSSQYSQQLLTTLNSALQNSGIDLSQASISVQINLGKRAVKRPAAGSTSSSKELIDPASNTEAMGHQLRLSNGTEELSYATKRQKSDNS